MLFLVSTELVHMCCYTAMISLVTSERILFSAGKIGTRKISSPMIQPMAQISTETKHHG